MAKSFGADIGYHTVKLYLPDEQTPYIGEPAVLALNGNDSVAACGNEALRLVQRVPGSVRLIRPFSGETTPDPAHASAFFSYLVKGKKLRGADLCFSLSGQQDDEAEQIIVEAAQKAGARDVMAVDALYAAATGCHVSSVAESAVINIGASVTDMGCFSRGKQVISASCPYAGNALDRAISSYVFKKYRLSLLPEEAERIKTILGTMSPAGGKAIEVSTLRPAMGLPKKLILSEEEVSTCLEEIFDNLTDEILGMTRRLPLEPDKVILTGGGANLTGLAAALAPLLCLPVVAAKEPEYAVIRGIAALMQSSQKK